MANLKNQIESLLFVSHKPITAKSLAKLLAQDEAAVKSALKELAEERKSSGIVVLEADEGYQLATHSDNSTAVKNFLNADLREKLTDATVEVLAIVAYRQPISKAELEAIRGVNSQYSLRALLMRGLVEKVPNPNDARGYLYQVTTEFLQHLGITKIEDLPEFNELVKEIKLPEVPQTQAEASPAENNETSR
jgi:segregation and condensation protein B